MTTARPLPTNLQDNLHQHLACAQALLDLLAEEHAALGGNDISALERISEAKAHATQDLARLGQHLARQCGVAPGPAADARIRAQGPVAARAWDELLALARRCQDDNLRNGALLGEHQRRNQSALAVLRGARGGASAYGRRGALPAVNDRRALASA